MTPAIIQGILEDGSIIAAQITRVVDGAVYGPDSKLDTIFLNNLLFIIEIIHLNLGAWKMLDSEEML